MLWFLLACRFSESMVSTVDASSALERDGDGDGYAAFEDCNDYDSEVYPGAREVPYDGIDNDCAPETPDDVLL